MVKNNKRCDNFKYSLRGFFGLDKLFSLRENFLFFKVEFRVRKNFVRGNNKFGIKRGSCKSCF